MRRIGSYEVVEEIGRGGMGVVYRAVDPTIGRFVAIKVVKLDDLTNPEEQKVLRDRLFREARAAGQLSHPGIVTIYQVGEYNRMAYIAMEYVPGITLQRLMADPPLSTEAVRQILIQAATALDYAHQCGVVHRDVKPANIIINQHGRVKICDFGIAKIDGSHTALTATGMTLGTPYYMSPEQVEGQIPKRQSDQYSLAVVAYEMLSGQLPFRAESLATLFRKILLEPPPPIHEWNPKLGKRVSDVLSRALSKDPEARYDSCGTFVEQLLEACEERPGWGPTGQQQAIVTENSGGAAARVLSPEHVVMPPGSAGVWLRGFQDPSPRQAFPSRIAARTRSRNSIVPAVLIVCLTLALGASAAYFFGRRSVVRSKSGAAAAPSEVTSAAAEKQGGAEAIQNAQPRKPPQYSQTRPRAEAEPPSLQSMQATAPIIPILPAPWPSFQGNAQHTGLAAVRGPRKPEILWTAVLGGQPIGSPVVGSGGTVYIIASDRRLYAIANGRILWTAAVGDVLDATPSIDGKGAISVRLSSGRSLHFAPDGGPVQTAFTPSLTTGETAESLDGRIYYIDGKILRRLEDSRWQVDLGDTASTFPSVDSSGNIYVGTSGGRFVCVDDRGKIRWIYRVPMRVTSSPAIKADGDVVFGCGDRNLYCLRNGELRWQYPTRGAIYSSPIIDQAGIIYFGSNDGVLYAIDDRGEEVWKIELQNEVRSSPAMDSNGRLYVASAARRVYCIGDDARR